MYFDDTAKKVYESNSEFICSYESASIFPEMSESEKIETVNFWINQQYLVDREEMEEREHLQNKF